MSTAPAAGDLITPSVRLVRPLGQGAMGIIWLADHLTLHTQVAVKLLLTGSGALSTAEKRFKVEASAVARIKSPHVVHVHDFGVTSSGHNFIVMELLEGQDLGEMLSVHGRLEVPRVIHYLQQICRGLTKAHAAGVVHRDIKPDNLFVTDPGGDALLKILDFGIAKRLDQNGDLTSMGMCIGTPYYMSPEQLLSTKDVDHRADLWSVAIVAYEMLTGVVPFRGETLGAISVNISQGRFVAPTKLVSKLPREVDAWMLRALAINPDERFATAAELFETFVLAADPAAGRPEAPRPSMRPRTSLASWEPLVSGTAASLYPPSTSARVTAVLGVLGIATIVGMAAATLGRNGSDPALGATVAQGAARSGSSDADTTVLTARTGGSTTTPEPDAVPTATPATPATPAPPSASAPGRTGDTAQRPTPRAPTRRPTRDHGFLAATHHDTPPPRHRPAHRAPPSLPGSVARQGMRVSGMVPARDG